MPESSNSTMHQSHKSPQLVPVRKIWEDSGHNTACFLLHYNWTDLLLLHLRVSFWKGMRIWLLRPEFLCLPQELRSFLPKVIVHKGLCTETTRRMVRWVGMVGHVIPLGACGLFMNDSNPVGNENIESCPLVLNVTQDRCTICPKLTHF